MVAREGWFDRADALHEDSKARCDRCGNIPNCHSLGDEHYVCPWCYSQIEAAEAVCCVLKALWEKMEVRVGDVWRDNDVRNSYEDHVRTIKIARVEGRYAYGVCEQSGRPTRIRLDRFDPSSSTGYTKVKEG